MCKDNFSKVTEKAIATFYRGKLKFLYEYFDSSVDNVIYFLNNTKFEDKSLLDILLDDNMDHYLMNITNNISEKHFYKIYSNNKNIKKYIDKRYGYDFIKMLINP